MGKNSSKKIRKCDFERRNVFTDNVRSFNYHCRHFMLVKGFMKSVMKGKNAVLLLLIQKKILTLNVNALRKAGWGRYAKQTVILQVAAVMSTALYMCSFNKTSLCIIFKETQL